MKKRILTLSLAFLTGSFVVMSCGAKKTEATEETTEESAQEAPADQLNQGESEEASEMDVQEGDSTSADQVKVEGENSQTNN